MFTKLTIFILCILGWVQAISQSLFESPKYPTEDFSYPVDIPISFAGNFGECRPNHFHSGLDFRTEGKENIPIKAIGDGYISRIKIEKGGFGNAIYITHLNGYVSVYAHLNTFFPGLEKYVREEQYKQKSWKIDIHLFPTKFPVRKGQFIAYSGNTGSSSGPHLHLEIRDAKTENPLNPLLFFKEIQDIKKPIMKLLACYDASKSIYEQNPITFPIQNAKLKKDTFELPFRKIYFGISADDFIQNMPGILGVYQMNMFVNDQSFFAWQLDNISYDITRYMNAHADYKYKTLKKSWIQLCTKLKNDQLKIYKSFTKENGVVQLIEGETKKIKIQVIDTKSNSQSIEFYIKGSKEIIAKSCNTFFTAGEKNKFSNSSFSLQLNEDALYDDVCFNTKTIPKTNPYSDLYQIHYNYVPVHSPFTLSIIPKSTIPKELFSKLVLQKTNNSGDTSKSATAAVLKNNRVEAEVKSFGNYEIMIDQKPPLIKTNIKDNQDVSKQKFLSFVVTEETTTLKNCDLYLNNQWLRLVQKGNTFTYEIDDYFPKGIQTITLIATDENNNKAIKTLTLKR